MRWMDTVALGVLKARAESRTRGLGLGELEVAIAEGSSESSGSMSAPLSEFGDELLVRVKKAV